MSIPRSLIRKMAADNAVYMKGYALYNTTFSHKIEPTVFTDLFHITAVFENKKVKTELEIDNANELNIKELTFNNNNIFSDGDEYDISQFKEPEIIRIKRESDKYSKISLNIKNIPEFKNFEELINSNYIDKIGENYE